MKPSPPIKPPIDCPNMQGVVKLLRLTQRYRSLAKKAVDETLPPNSDRSVLVSLIGSDACLDRNAVRLSA